MVPNLENWRVISKFKAVVVTCHGDTWLVREGVVLVVHVRTALVWL